MEQVTVFLQSVKSLCQQPTLASITLPQTKLKNPLVLLMRYEKDPFSDTWAQQAQSRGGEKTPCPKEMHGAIDRQWNKLAGHTGPQLLAQGQAWLCAWTFAALHKTCSCFTAREFSLPWWRDWLCHTTRHLQVTVPVLRGTHSIHCPGERAEMSEGQDRVLCALTSVPSSPCALRVVWVHRTFASIHFGLFLWWHFFPQLPVLREKQKDLPPSNNPLVSAAAANQRFRGKNKRVCKSFY